MKHFYLAHRTTGKKPLPSKTDNQLREQLIKAGNIRPGEHKHTQMVGPNNKHS